MFHKEKHRTQHIGWLRAAVLGANDGIVSTASLIVGVAAAQVAKNDVLIAGVAGLVAGAMSMAAGEYVSVSSQADTENADLERERRELEDELTSIYIKRGLDEKLAKQVADQLMAHDALGAHARDELGISEVLTARPVQAAFSSAATFALGAAMPLLSVLIFPASTLIWAVSLISLLCLALLGVFSAQIGGSSLLMAASRVTFWGALAMAITAGVGALFGVAV